MGKAGDEDAEEDADGTRASLLSMEYADDEIVTVGEPKEDDMMLRESFGDEQGVENTEEGLLLREKDVDGLSVSDGDEGELIISGGGGEVNKMVGGGFCVAALVGEAVTSECSSWEDRSERGLLSGLS